MKVVGNLFCRRISKFANYDSPVILHENVLGIQIAMIDPDSMARIHCIQDLGEYILNLVSASPDNEFLLSLRFERNRLINDRVKGGTVFNSLCQYRKLSFSVH